MRVDKKFIYVFYFFVVVQGMGCPCCKKRGYIPLNNKNISSRIRISSLTPIYYGKNDNYIRFYKNSEEEINGLNDFLAQIPMFKNEKERQDFYEKQRKTDKKIQFLEPVEKDELLKMCEVFNSFYFYDHLKIGRYLILSPFSFSSEGYVNIFDQGGGKRFFLQKFWDMFEEVVWNKETDKDNIGIVPLPGKFSPYRELIIKTLSSFTLYVDKFVDYFCPNFGWPIFYYRILADLTEDNHEKVKLEDYMYFGEFIDLLTRFNYEHKKNPFQNKDLKIDKNTKMSDVSLKKIIEYYNIAMGENAEKLKEEELKTMDKTSLLQKCFHFMGDDLVGDLWIFKKNLKIDTFSSGESIESMRERCEGGDLSFENLKLALCPKNPKDADGYQADKEALEATKKMLNIVEKYIEEKFNTEKSRKKEKLEFLTSFCNFVLGMKALKTIYVFAQNNNFICVKAGTCSSDLYVDKNALLENFDEVVEEGKKQSPRYPHLAKFSHDKYNDSDINKMAWAMFAFLYLEENVKTGMVEN